MLKLTFVTIAPTDHIQRQVQKIRQDARYFDSSIVAGRGMVAAGRA